MSLLCYCGHILWLDTVDLSDHGPVGNPFGKLQELKVGLGQWPSFTGLEHGTQHTRVVRMAMGLVREVVECKSW